MIPSYCKEHNCISNFYDKLAVLTLHLGLAMLDIDSNDMIEVIKIN